LHVAGPAAQNESTMIRVGERERRVSLLTTCSLLTPPRRSDRPKRSHKWRIFCDHITMWANIETSRWCNA